MIRLIEICKIRMKLLNFNVNKTVNIVIWNVDVINVLWFSAGGKCIGHIFIPIAFSLARQLVDTEYLLVKKIIFSSITKGTYTLCTIIVDNDFMGTFGDVREKIQHVCVYEWMLPLNHSQIYKGNQNTTY